ncbi:hypothetical protein SAMN04489712_105285 [Thermomonospora echinospora]|uniref:Uncharacterized protein n=1 Tax=Thermomonospora echinospora TaxID=1992 RepID=A0A1H6AAJ3_9ACTN|nr:hypothetical protein [Thermomonospora echinospora]SEG45077.1 hypothetical protein SAMN04489712_105285 [Thermomonospora echinospora]
MSLGMMYTAVFTGVAVTAQQDLFELTAPSTRAVVIHQVVLSQSTEVGDAQEESLSVLLRRGSSATTSGSGGGTATPARLQSGFAAAGSTVEINNTTKMSGGTITTVHSENWNVRAPLVILPPPELRIVLSPGERFTVELAATPADSFTVSGTLYFEEIGG